jgi:hypothetical protein
MTPIIWLLLALLGNFQEDCCVLLSRNFYFKKTIHVGLNLLFNLNSSKLCEFQGLLQYCNPPEFVKAVPMDALPTRLGIKDPSHRKFQKSVKVI